MSEKKNTWWKKIKAWVTGIFHWLYPYRIFEAEPMKFRFVKVYRPKMRYEIKQKFFSFSIKSKDDIFKYAFFILMLVLLFVIPYFGRNVGISTREWMQNEYSEAVYNYYHSGDETFKEMPQYVTKGQSADILIVSVAHFFGIKDVFAIKHFLSALLGWVLILVTGLFFGKNVSWRSAFFCSLLMFCTPRFLGYTFGNFNDTLFALAFFFTLFQIWQFCYDLPLIRWIRVFGIFLGILVATITSLCGFALCMLFFVFTMFYFLVKNPIKKFFTRQYCLSMVTLIVIIVLTAVLVILLNLVLSPGFHITDLRNSHQFMQLFVATSQQLPQFFEGRMIGVEMAPANLLLKYIFITTPFVVIVGFVLYVLFFRTILRELSLFNTFALLFTFFYLLWIFSSRYMGPDIVNTAIFVIMPFVVILATLGYEAVLQRVDDRYTNSVIVILAIFLICLPLRHVILNRPFTLCYFNEVSGGIHSAAERYELDINNQSSRVAEQWFTEYFKGVRDSLNVEAEQQQKHAVQQGENTSQKEETQQDSQLSSTRPRIVTVYTNGNEAFCQALAKGNADIQVFYAEIHSLDELEGDYYILFGNRTGLFKQIDRSFKTIDLEKVPIVSFFQKKSKSRQQNFKNFVFRRKG